LRALRCQSGGAGGVVQGAAQDPTFHAPPSPRRQLCHPLVVGIRRIIILMQPLAAGAAAGHMQQLGWCWCCQQHVPVSILGYVAVAVRGEVHRI